MVGNVPVSSMIWTVCYSPSNRLMIIADCVGDVAVLLGVLRMVMFFFADGLKPSVLRNVKHGLQNALVVVDRGNAFVSIIIISMVIIRLFLGLFAMMQIVRSTKWLKLCGQSDSVRSRVGG